MCEMSGRAIGSVSVSAQEGLSHSKEGVQQILGTHCYLQGELCTGTAYLEKKISRTGYVNFLEDALGVFGAARVLGREQMAC